MRGAFGSRTAGHLARVSDVPDSGSWPAAITVVCRLALVGLVLVLVVLSYYPFTWDPPRTVRNEVTRSTAGFLRFGAMNDARSPGTPAWLPDVAASGTIEIQLEAAPLAARQDASIMMLASDSWHTDFAIGQDGSDLALWLRRPDSNINGDPPFVVSGVLQPHRWNSITVIVRRGELRIDVAGRTRLTAHLPADFARVWGQGRIALGDEVHGGGPWQGQIRLARVVTPDHAVDYIRPGKLAIPASFLYLPDHIEPFPPMGRQQWLYAALDLVSFIPLGFLIVLAARRPMRIVSATLLATVFAVALGAGKFLFYGRHAAAINLAAQMAGGLLGAFLAAWLARVWLPARRNDRRPEKASSPGTVLWVLIGRS
jgi:hypothetical protein